MHVKTTAILITSALMAGCSGSDDVVELADPETLSEIPESTLPTDGDASGQTSMPAPGTDPSDAPQPLTRFDGNYLRACTLVNELDGGVWEVNELSIQGDTGASTLTQYSDSECTQPTLIEITTFSFIYPGGTANTALGVADFIDVTIEGETLDGVDVFSDMTQLFDLILLDGNSLFVGLTTEELDGSTPETRPVDIDESISLMRL